MAFSSTVVSPCMSSDSAPEPLKVFRQIATGCGGVFDLNPPNKPSAIGTMECTTCVGVYCKLNERRCLVLHINAWRLYEEGNLPKPQDLLYPLNEAEAARLKEIVRYRIIDCFVPHWEPTQQQRESLIMVCPRLHMGQVEGLNDTQQPLVGLAVMEAVADVFGGDVAAAYRKEAHGFIVDPQEGKTVLLEGRQMMSNNIPRVLFLPPTYGYCGELLGGLDPWTFEYDEDAERWMTWIGLQYRPFSLSDN